MCIARVGKVTSVEGTHATVEFFDGKTLDDVDVGLLKVRRGMFVEVFGNLALSEMTPTDARERKALWKEVRRTLIAT